MAEYEWRRLCKWLKNYYRFEYKELDESYKNNMIEYVILHNKDIITPQEVVDFDACSQCGYCCRTMHCPDFDENTNLCTSHDEQRWVICQTAPYGDPDFGLLLNLGINCTYLTAFLVDYLNKVFDKAMEMKSNES